MLLKKPPLIIDNCVLGNLYSAGRLLLLDKLYSGDLIIPTHVLEEASLKRGLYNEIHTLEKDEIFKTYTINKIKEIRRFAALERRFKDNGEVEAKGEAAVLTIVDILDATVCSDNISDIKPYIDRHDMELKTTISILYDAYSVEFISFEEGQNILDKIVDDGNKMPVDNFQKVIDWFEHEIGKELF